MNSKVEIDNRTMPAHVAAMGLAYALVGADAFAGDVRGETAGLKALARAQRVGVVHDLAADHGEYRSHARQLVDRHRLAAVATACL